MISPLYSKLAACRKWIFVTATLWTIVLIVVARSTAKFRRHQQQFETQAEFDAEDSNERLADLQRDNERLRNDLKKLPELAASVAQLRKEMAPAENIGAALWATQSNALLAAIEQKKGEITELNQWFTERARTEQREAAEQRLAEKAKEPSVDPEKDFVELTDTLQKLALARKRVIEIVSERKQSDIAARNFSRPRLKQAQEEWMAANERLGKDNALFQAFPLTNTPQDPGTILFLRSVIPDQNGMSISVYLDGTVNLSKTTDHH